MDKNNALEEEEEHLEMDPEEPLVPNPRIGGGTDGNTWWTGGPNKYENRLNFPMTWFLPWNSMFTSIVTSIMVEG